MNASRQRSGAIGHATDSIFTSSIIQYIQLHFRSRAVYKNRGAYAPIPSHAYDNRAKETVGLSTTSSTSHTCATSTIPSPRERERETTFTAESTNNRVRLLRSWNSTN